MVSTAIRSSLVTAGPLQRVALALLLALVLSVAISPTATLSRSYDVGLSALTLKQEAVERSSFVLKAPSQQPDHEQKSTGPVLVLPSPVAAYAPVQARLQIAAAGTREVRRYPSRPSSQGPPALT